MIYGYLHAQHEVYVRWREWPGPGYFSSQSEAHWRRGTEQPPDYWWNPEFTGALMVREMSEHYFRNVCIQFGDDFQSIPKFRITDQWRLGYTPSQVIANIGVTIRCGSYDFEGLELMREEESPWDQSASGWGGIESPPRRDPRSDLLSALELLFGFRQGTKISLRVWANRALKGTFLEKQKWMCDNVIPFILPTLQRFGEAGYKVRVIISRHGWDEPRYGYGWDRTNRDFTLEGTALSSEVVKNSFKAVSPFFSKFNVRATILTILV